MDPQGETAARLAGTPAKVVRSDEDGVADAAAAAHVSTPSADKAMLLSSPAAFSFPRKHPPPLSSKPRKATSLFRHPASEAGKKGNDYKTDVSSSPLRHEDGASKPGLGDSSSAGSAATSGHHTTADLDQEDGEARTHGVGPTLWSGGSGEDGGSGSGSGSGVGACFGSPARPPKENITSFRFTPQRNLNGLFASPVPPPPPTSPPASLSGGDDLPGLGNSDRKTGLVGGPAIDDLSMLRFPRKMQQASESEPPAGELCADYRYCCSIGNYILLSSFVLTRLTALLLHDILAASSQACSETCGMYNNRGKCQIRSSGGFGYEY